MPAAAESFVFPDADLVISTSHAVAKGVIPPPGAFHLSYVHTPMRYVWDQRNQYLDPIPRVLRPIVEMRFARLRQWDMVSSARVDRLVANSRLVAWRIKHYWNRTAEVIPPPVATEYFTPGGERAGNLLTVAALVPYKRVEDAIAVARKLGRTLEIVGTGPRMRALRRLGGSDVRFLGWLERDELREAYRRAAALLVPNVEDFGMVSVEALACGTPVVGLAHSGTADVVRAGVEGELAEESSVDALVDATDRVLGRAWDCATAPVSRRPLLARPFPHPLRIPPRSAGFWRDSAVIERRRQIQVLLQLVGDILATVAAVFIAYWLRFEVQVQPVTKGLPSLQMYLRLVPVVMVLYPVVFYFQSLYQRRRIRSRFDESMRVVVAVLLATVLLTAGLTFYRPPDFTYSRLFLAIFATVDVILVGLSRDGSSGSPSPASEGPEATCSGCWWSERVISGAWSWNG